MEYIISLLISYGYWGMLITAFVAGSFFPFSSEAVMTGLLAAGLDPWGLIIYGTIGNVAGGMFNYFVGRMGKLEWIRSICMSSRMTWIVPPALWQDAVRGWAFLPLYPFWDRPSPSSWD